jgi:hypothetical protein
VSNTFGAMVEEAARRKGWSDYQLSAAIGLLPGDRPFNPTQIRRLRRGERQHLTQELVQRLIDVLGLDPPEAWAASGLLPSGVTADMIRRLPVFDGMMSAPAGFARERRHPLRRRHLRLVEHVEQVAA